METTIGNPYIKKRIKNQQETEYVINVVEKVIMLRGVMLKNILAGLSYLVSRVIGHWFPS